MSMVAEALRVLREITHVELGELATVGMRERTIIEASSTFGPPIITRTLPFSDSEMRELFALCNGLTFLDAARMGSTTGSVGLRLYSSTELEGAKREVIAVRSVVTRHLAERGLAKVAAQSRGDDFIQEIEIIGVIGDYGNRLYLDVACKDAPYGILSTEALALGVPSREDIDVKWGSLSEFLCWFASDVPGAITADWRFQNSNGNQSCIERVLRIVDGGRMQTVDTHRLAQS